MELALVTVQSAAGLTLQYSLSYRLAMSRTRWQIAPQPLEVLQFGWQEIVGLVASYPPV